MSQGIKIPVFVGNTVRHTINLRRFGQNAPADVSGATQILLEWELPDGTNQAPIPVSELEPGADWANGAVVVVIAPPITNAQADYPFGLTVFIAGEEITYDCGEINVRNRPGYPYP
jgi:hypothetical protein